MCMIIRRILLLITLMILSNHWKKRSGSLKNDPGECHLLISNNEYDIENSDCEKLLGGKLDWKLNFDDHISDSWKKARGKLNVLVRIEPFIEFLNF